MKEVWVMRHGDWVHRSDVLTDSAIAKCLSLRNRIGPFERAIASPFDHAAETARLITGNQPELDSRASLPQLNSEETNRVLATKDEHSLGMAGVLFSTPAFLPRAKAAGQQLVSLIEDTLRQLPEGGKALIITHEGTLCAAEKILTKGDFNVLDKTYYELEGFIVGEEGYVRSFIYRKDGPV